MLVTGYAEGAPGPQEGGHNSVHTPHHSRGFSIMAPMTLVHICVSMPLT